MHPVVPTLPSVRPKVRQRAAAIVVHCGRVLLHQVEGESVWALPGGAIEPGESASEAVARELLEELGAGLGGAVSVGRLAVVAENFFDHGGASFHEIGLYLHASPSPGSALVLSEGPYDGVEGHRTLVFAWFKAAELASLDLRPSMLRGYLRDLLQSMPADVLHVVRRDGPQPAHTSTGPDSTPP
ncbi:MAG: NUDIX domain-containing protein [Comamonadaceae bacterium]|nr:MAG: NUDIX domain-containing protein [Comamonadaceae bacterium]